jgi:hypothetical protein
VISRGQRAVALLVVGATSLALAGCGSSGRRDTSAGEWIDHADAACARANDAIRALNRDPANRAEQGSWTRVQASFSRFRAISRRELSTVRALRLPPGAARLPRRLITLMRQRDEALARQLAAADQRDLRGFEQDGEAGTDAFVPFVLLAHRFSMHACADSVAVRAGASAGTGAIVRGALAVTWWCNEHAGMLPAGDAELVTGATRELVRAASGHPDAVVPYLVATTGAPRTFRASLHLTASTLRNCGTAPLAARLAREASSADRALAAG